MVCSSVLYLVAAIFFGNGKYHCIGHTLPQGPVVHSIPRVVCSELGNSGSSHRMVLMEVLQFVHRQTTACQMQPTINEHGSMTGAQNEPIAIDPCGILGVVLKQASVKSGSSYFSSTQSKTHVAGMSSGDGSHGETSCFICGCVIIMTLLGRRLATVELSLWFGC